MRNICPATRLPCGHVEVCWLAYCAVLRMKGGYRARPIDDRELTTAERYAAHMAEQKVMPARTTREKP